MRVMADPKGMGPEGSQKRRSTEMISQGLRYEQEERIKCSI
jgi:hypothetical protein